MRTSNIKGDPSSTGAITDIFIPKSEWVSNSDNPRCSLCQAKFGLVNRRHHCRMCGKLFDSQCCRYVYPPTFVYRDEKKIRLCNICYKKSQAYLIQGTLSSNSLTTDLQRTQDIENGLQILLTTRLYQLSDEVLSYILTQNQLNQEWYDILKSIVKETLELITPSKLRHDQMDINNFIKIKKIPYKDQSLTQVVKGVMIRKNVTHKKMTKNMTNSSVLMIRGNLDESIADEISLLDASSVDRGKEVLRTVIKKILKLNPQLIVVEGNVNRLAQEMLHEANKTLITKVRRNQFKYITRAVRAKVVKNIDELTNFDQNVLGTCKRFSVDNYQNKCYYKTLKSFPSEQILDSFDPSLMVFEGFAPFSDATVLISGPDCSQLIQVKKCLRHIFHILQIIFFEKSMIYQEISLYYSSAKLWKILSNGLNRIDLSNSNEFRKRVCLESHYPENIQEVTKEMCLLNESAAATSGYTTDFVTERYTLEKVTEDSTFIFTKLVLVPIDVTSFPDLADLSTTALEKMTENLKNSNRWHREELCQIEKRPEAVKVYCYKKGDMTLGDYLLNKISRLSEKCVHCNRSFYNHIFFFFTKQFYIKITLHLLDTQKLHQIKKDAQKAKIRPSNGRGNTIRHQQSEGFFDYLAGVAQGGKKEINVPIPSLSPNSHELTSISNSPDPHQHHHQKKRKGSVDLLKDVKMYIECSQCRNILSETAKLKQNYLECSFIGYLESLTTMAEKYKDYLLLEEKGASRDGIPNKFLDSIKDVPLSSNVLRCCPYSPKNRVFIIDDLAIKFRVGYTNPYSFDSVKYGDAKSVEISQQLNAELIATKKKKFIDLKKSYLWLVFGTIKEALTYLSNKSNLNLSMDNISNIETIVSNPVSKDPYHTLLCDVIPLYREVADLLQETEIQANKEIKSHFEVEIWNREFFQKLMSLVETLEKKRSSFIRSFVEPKESKKKEKARETREAREAREARGLEVANNTSDQNSRSLYDAPSYEYEMEDSLSRTYTVEDEIITESRVNQSQDILPKEGGENKMILSQDILQKEDLPEPQSAQRNEIDKEMSMMEQLTTGLHFNTGMDNSGTKPFLKFDYMPVDENQPLSVIAYSLNSAQYMKEIYIQEGFLEHEALLTQGTLSMNLRKFIESKLLMEENESNKAFNSKIPMKDIEVKYLNRLATSLPGKSEYRTKKRKTISPEILEDFSRFIETSQNLGKSSFSERLVTPSIQVITYYPAHFEALRMFNDLKLEDYLLSLSCSQNWEDNTGGKTGANFIKTHDQKLVFKQLGKKEFSMLLGFAPKYLNYMWHVCGSDQPSLLAKIFGIYEIQSDKKSKYYIAMENMFYGLGKGLKVYDLKGSELNRYATKKGDEEVGTLLDTNYTIDRNGEPLPIKSKYYIKVKEGIKQDSCFLASLKVVDYSLLLILDENNSTVRMGIIDYLRMYDLEKHLEHVGKRIINGTTPTITEPDDYKERFQKAMKLNFMEVSDE